MSEGSLRLHGKWKNEGGKKEAYAHPHGDVSLTVIQSSHRNSSPNRANSTFLRDGNRHRSHPLVSVRTVQIYVNSFLDLSVSQSARGYDGRAAGIVVDVDVHAVR
jgi:hypothetical protein